MGKAEARKKEEYGTIQVRLSSELNTVLAEEPYAHDGEKKLNEDIFLKIVNTDTEHIQTRPNGIAIGAKSYTNSAGILEIESMNKNMQSQRSESEQKRLDDLHMIFGQAGLLSRVKRISQAKVEIEDRTILS